MSWQGCFFTCTYNYVASRLSDGIIQQIDLTDTPGHVCSCQPVSVTLSPCGHHNQIHIVIEFEEGYSVDKWSWTISGLLTLICSLAYTALTLSNFMHMQLIQLSICSSCMEIMEKTGFLFLCNCVTLSFRVSSYTTAQKVIWVKANWNDQKESPQVPLWSTASWYANKTQRHAVT